MLFRSCVPGRSAPLQEGEAEDARSGTTLLPPNLADISRPGALGAGSCGSERREGGSWDLGAVGGGEGGRVGEDGELARRLLLGCYGVELLEPSFALQGSGR